MVGHDADRGVVCGIRDHAAIAKATAEQIKVGDPTDQETQIGPLVSETQFNKVQALIQKGIDEGATLQTGGVGRPDGLNRGYFVKPTIFSDVNSARRIERQTSSMSTISPRLTPRDWTVRAPATSIAPKWPAPG